MKYKKAATWTDRLQGKDSYDQPSQQSFLGHLLYCLNEELEAQTITYDQHTQLMEAAAQIVGFRGASTKGNQMKYKRSPNMNTRNKVNLYKRLLRKAKAELSGALVKTAYSDKPLNWWSRQEMQEYLEGRGFAVYDDEPEEDLKEAIRLDMEEEGHYASAARRAAVNSTGKEVEQLQALLEQGKIDSDEFESRMEELESRSRSSRMARFQRYAGRLRRSPAPTYAGAADLLQKAYTATANAEKRLETDRKLHEEAGDDAAHDLVDEARQYTWDAMNGLNDALDLLAEPKTSREIMDRGPAGSQEFLPLEPKRSLGRQPAEARVKTADNFQRDPFDEFFSGYVETALWSSNDESDESGGQPLDENYTSEDIAAECLAQMEADCRAFFDANYTTIDEAEVTYGPDYGKWAHVGHDFWLTRNGHGAGFWDGDYSEPADEILTEAAEAFGETDLYIGDDGQIYCS